VIKVVIVLAYQVECLAQQGAVFIHPTTCWV